MSSVQQPNLQIVISPPTTECMQVRTAGIKRSGETPKEQRHKKEHDTGKDEVGPKEERIHRLHGLPLYGRPFSVALTRCQGRTGLLVDECNASCLESRGNDAELVALARIQGAAALCSPFSTLWSMVPSGRIVRHGSRGAIREAILFRRPNVRPHR